MLKRNEWLRQYIDLERDSDKMQFSRSTFSSTREVYWTMSFENISEHIKEPVDYPSSLKRMDFRISLDGSISVYPDNIIMRTSILSIPDYDEEKKLLSDLFLPKIEEMFFGLETMSISIINKKEGILACGVEFHIDDMVPVHYEPILNDEELIRLFPNIVKENVAKLEDEEWKSVSIAISEDGDFHFKPSGRTFTYLDYPVFMTAKEFERSSFKKYIDPKWDFVLEDWKETQTLEKEFKTFSLRIRNETSDFLYKCPIEDSMLAVHAVSPINSSKELSDRLDTRTRVYSMVLSFRQFWEKEFKNLDDISSVDKFYTGYMEGLNSLNDQIYEM